MLSLKSVIDNLMHPVVKYSDVRHVRTNQKPFVRKNALCPLVWMETNEEYHMNL